MEKIDELDKKNKELESRIEELEGKIAKIKNRNTRVEGDKAWETSLARTCLIIVCTYVFALLYLFVADTTNPFLGAVVPCAGFFLSTLTIRPIKRYYIKRRNDKLNK